MTGNNNDQTDDGIGTSDDETNSNPSSGNSEHEAAESEAEENHATSNLASRRVIKLDLAAVSQLLAFDEVCSEDATFYFPRAILTANWRAICRGSFLIFPAFVTALAFELQRGDPCPCYFCLKQD